MNVDAITSSPMNSAGPTVNSHKRLVLKGSMSGFTWAPVWACYGNNKRTNTLRIPLGGDGWSCVRRIARATLGGAMRGAWLEYKRDAWTSYTNHVSDWEKARYLEFY